MLSSILILFVAMISIQFGASMAKQLFPVLGPEGTTVLRVTVAALILALVFKPWKTRLSRKDLAVVAAYGASLGFMNLIFYLSLQRIPLGIAVALEFTGPLAVALYSSRKPIDLLWTALAAAGIWFILPHTENESALDLLGILLALGAGVFWALYIIIGQKAGKKAHSGSITAIGMIFAALFTLPFGITKITPDVLTFNVIAIGLGMAILSSALPYSLEMVALKKLPTKTFGILMSLEPAIAAIAGLMFLSEKLTIIQWVAILCVIIASAGSTLLAKPEKPQVQV